MKKKIFIAFAVLLVCTAGTLFWLAANANSLIEGRRADIEKLASEALSANVTFGKISTSLFPEAQITLSDLNIKPAKAKGNSDNGKGVTLKSFIVHVGLFPLLGGKLDVRKLSIEEPVLTVISDENGVYLEGLPPAAKKELPKRKGSKGTSGKKKEQAQASTAPPLPSWIQFELDGFALTNASLTYRDKKSNKDLSVTKINADAAVSLQNNTITIPNATFSLVLPGEVKISSTLNGLTYSLSSQDLKLTTLDLSFPEGSVLVEASGNLATMAVNAKIESTGIGLAPFEPVIKAIAPTAPLAGLTGKVTPDVNISTKSAKQFSLTGALGLDNIGLDSNGIRVTKLGGKIDLNVTETTQVVSTNTLQTTIGDQLLQIVFTATNSAHSLDLKPMTISGFGGNINLETTMQHNKEMPVSSLLTINSVEIGRALSAIKPGATETLSGTLQSLSSKLHLKLGDKDMMSTIRGGGKVLLVDAKLKQVNLAAEVLGAIRDLPFLSGSLASSVPEDQQSELKKDYTTITRLTADYAIGNSVVSLTSLDVLSTLFSLRGRGTSTLDGDVKLDTTILFSADLSASLVGAIKELEHALNSEGQLPVPLVIEGKAPDLTLLPDTKALAKQAAKAVIKKQAGKLIDKALGGKTEGVGESIGNLLGF